MLMFDVGLVSAPSGTQAARVADLVGLRMNWLIQKDRYIGLYFESVRGAGFSVEHRNQNDSMIVLPIGKDMSDELIELAADSVVKMLARAGIRPRPEARGTILPGQVFAHAPRS